MIRIISTLALLAIAIAAPVAQAYPDAFERAVIAHQDTLRAYPADAFERAVIAHQSMLPMERRSPDARDTAVAAQVPYVPLDPAFVSAIRAHRSEAVSAPIATGTTAGEFHWSTFGLGAGAMLGLLASLGSLRKLRRGDSQAAKA